MARALLADVEVGRLRVRGAGADGPGLRRGVDAAVAGTDLRPPGMAPGAILIVRRLRGNAALRWRGAAVEADPAWGPAARDAMAAAARTAARPLAGRVPDDAAAVLFADHAELVACLLADLAAGRAAARWWWALVLPRLAPARTTAAVMERQAEALPGALHLLAARGQVAPVAASIDEAAARRVLVALATAHRAPQLAALDRPDAPARASPPPGSEAVGGAPEPAGAAVPNGAAPWERWLPAGLVPAGLAPHQELLVAAGALLAIRAATVRSPEFGAAARGWLATAAAARPGAATRAVAAAASPPPPPPPPPPGRAPGGSAPLPATAPDAAAPAAHPPPPRARAGADPTRGVAAAPPPGAPATRGGARAPAPSAAVPPEAAVAIPPDLPPGRHPPDPVAATEPTPEPPPREGVASGLAGVMYLVNAVAWLDPPRHLPELAIGPWELVELLGRWLVAPAERWLGDPVWGELALLDGREPGTLPGCSVAAGAEYGLPAAWWEPYADLDADRYWARQAGTVRTWSSHGFLLADGPAGTVPTHGRRRPPAAAPLARLAAPAVAGLSAGSAWWLARLGPYVASRLAAELDVPQAALHAELLDRPGRLHATRTHVDVEMPLDAVSLRVRRAGLDRNPGWLPWFGRVVTFHFE